MERKPYQPPVLTNPSKEETEGKALTTPGETSAFLGS